MEDCVHKNSLYLYLRRQHTIGRRVDIILRVEKYHVPETMQWPKCSKRFPSNSELCSTHQRVSNRHLYIVSTEYAEMIITIHIKFFLCRSLFPISLIELHSGTNMLTHQIEALQVLPAPLSITGNRELKQSSILERYFPKETRPNCCK